MNLLSAQMRSQWNELGIAQWRPVSDTVKGNELKYRIIRSKLKKQEVPKKTNTFYKKQISAHTRKLSNSLPDTVHVQFEWIPKTVYPQKVQKAAPFYFRDNSSMNVTYKDAAHGFLTDAILAFAEDEKSNIWMISNTHIYKYDGLNYYSYSFEQVGVSTILAGMIYNAADSSLWISTQNGLFRMQDSIMYTCNFMDLDRNQFLSENLNIDKLGRIWVHATDCGSICFDTKGNAFSYKKTKGLRIDNIRYAHVDKDNNTWLLTLAGMYKFTTEGVYYLFPDTKSIRNNFMNTCFENQDGMWFGAFNSGLIRIHGKDTLNYSINNSFAERIYFIRKTGNTFWYNIYGYGIIKWIDDNQYFPVGVENGLVGRNAYHIMQDSYHNLWVSDLFSGISRVNENIFYKLTDIGKDYGDIRNIKMAPDGRRWFFYSGNPTMREDTDKYVFYSNVPGPLKYELLYNHDGVPMADGSVWTGTYGEGIVHFNDNYYDLYQYSDQHFPGIINNACIDDAENIWFSSIQSGILKMNHATKKLTQYTEGSGLISNRSSFLKYVNGWGICIAFESGMQRLHKYKLFTLFLNDKPLSMNFTGFEMLKDGSLIMMTNDNGVLWLKNGVLLQLNSKNGLQSDVVKSVIQDSANIIWIATESGISKVENKDNYDFDVINYSASYGLMMSKLGNSVFLSNIGLPIWNLVAIGLFKFDPEFSKPHINKPKFEFLKYSLNDIDLNPSQQIPVLYPDDLLKIQYTVKYWGYEDELQHFCYLIHTNEKDTIKMMIAKPGEIIISDINPSEYKLILVVKYNDSYFYSNDIIELKIFNFWYNSKWFYFLLSIIFILVIFIFFRYRAIEAKRQNILLEDKVQMRTLELRKERDELERSNIIIIGQNNEKDALVHEIHHRVKNNLQYISAILNMQIRISDDDTVKEVLADTARRLDSVALVHELLYNQDNIALLSTTDYIHQLCGLFSQMAVNQLQEPNITMQSDPILLDTNRTIALGIITLEIINNSIKHAFSLNHDPRIHVKLKYNPVDDLVVFTIHDNGNGLGVKMDNSKGMGKRLVDIFARQVNANYSFTQDNGTIFNLSFKYGT
jgi:two-component sensor histidine kinase/ligand-binding sensor domain-containing protein